MKVTVNVNPILSFLWFVSFIINTSITVSSAPHSEQFHYRTLNNIVFQTSYILVPTGDKKWGGPSPFPK